MIGDWGVSEGAGEVDGKKGNNRAVIGGAQSAHRVVAMKHNALTAGGKGRVNKPGSLGPTAQMNAPPSGKCTTARKQTGPLYRIRSVHDGIRAFSDVSYLPQRKRSWGHVATFLNLLCSYLPPFIKISQTTATALRMEGRYLSEPGSRRYVGRNRMVPSWKGPCENTLPRWRSRVS